MSDDGIGVSPNDPSLELDCEEVRELLNKNILFLSISQLLAIVRHCDTCPECRTMVKTDLLRKLEKEGDDSTHDQL